MKYTVHLYISCRVKFEGIEAESQAEAIQKAEARFDSSTFFNNDGDATRTPIWDEAAPLGALVDEEGDEEYERSRYHELEGVKVYQAS